MTCEEEIREIYQTLQTMTETVIKLEERIKLLEKEIDERFYPD